mmetsp:Transcript_4900/g.10980  ORF Transcript_4900/g.10980 Transcript_4900/m.10980 type:complete len:650 (+) Transcript_4900:394-2343(+)
MAASSNIKKDNYYKTGSDELATETPLTLTRLETRRMLTNTSSRLVIVLVGLPARGKSFVARKMQHFLNWTGVLCKIFNVGKYRREAYASLQREQGSDQQNSGSGSGEGACDANFFDPNNVTAAQLRERVAQVALKDMLAWLDEVDDNAVGEDETSTHDTSTHGGINLQPKLQYRQNERIAIFDATNSTHQRRNWVLEQCTSPQLRGNKTTGCVFVESICNDQELLMENYKFKISNSPDFTGMTEEAALADLLQRVTKYEQQYQTITDDSLSYIKIYDLSTKLLCNHIYGRIAKDLVPALMAWHIGSRPIFLCRPGQTTIGVDGEDYVNKSKMKKTDLRQLNGLSIKARKKSMRGDSLGPAGMKFRGDLLEFMAQEVKDFLSKQKSVQDMAATGTSISGLSGLGGGHWYFGGYGSSYEHDSDNDEDGGSFSNQVDTAIDENNSNSISSMYGSGSFPLRVLTSTMPRAVDTVVWEFDSQVNVHQMSSLNPLDKGDFAGMELDEMREENPVWYEQLEADPYGTRFPGGECYQDLIRRLTSVVIDMEQQVIPTLVVSHVSILQCLMAYFRNTPIDNCMSIEVPMHTVIKFEPVRGGGFRETQHYLGEGVPDSLVRVSSSDAGENDALPSNNSGSPNNTSRALPIWGDAVPPQK